MLAHSGWPLENREVVARHSYRITHGRRARPVREVHRADQPAREHVRIGEGLGVIKNRRDRHADGVQ